MIRALSVNNRLKTVTDIVYLALCFAVPLSAAAISVGFSLLVIFWLLQGNFKAKWAAIVANKLFVAILIFFILHIVALLWTSTPVDGFKSWMFFLVPVWATVVSRDIALKGVYYFIAGMMVAEGWVYYMLVHSWATYIAGGYSNNLYLAGGHISYNPMLALAIAFLFSLLMFRKLKGWRFWISFLFVVTMTVNMFLTGGRAGQVGLFFALSFLAVYYFRQKPIRLFAAFAGIVIMNLLAYQFSPLFKHRLDSAVQEVIGYHQNPNTSVGMRMQFIENSFVLFKESPLLGHGTGSFYSAYDRINPIGSQESLNFSNPHNYHILVLVQFGIIGLIMHWVMYLQMFRIAGRFDKNSEYRPLAFLLPAFLFLINFSESYLWVHYTQALFALLISGLYRHE